MTVVMLDLVTVKLNRKSFLSLSYAGVGPTLIVFLLWGVGAIIVAGLGLLGEVLTVTDGSALVVGGSWPLIVPRLFSAPDEKVEIEQGKEAS